MPIAEALVESVVADTSQRMKDPQYVQLALGEFVQSQRHLSQYLSSRAAKLGGAEALVTIVFHSQIICECFRRSLKADVPAVDFATLDRASRDDPAKRFAEREPALSSYVASNVEEAELRLELQKVGLALSLACVARVVRSR
jgi:hypothetical protein